MTEPSIEEIRDAIEKYASLGVQIHVTELDISVHEYVHEPDKSSAAARVFDERLEREQADRYEQLLQLFREYSRVIRNVTWWGIADDETWRDNFPVKNRKDWPLMFNEQHQPKEAFWRAVNFAK